MSPTTRDLFNTADVDCDRIRQRVESMFEAGILMEQPRSSRKSGSIDIVDDVALELTGRLLKVLEPEDWKTSTDRAADKPVSA
jgi:hypothetical protein